MVLLTTSIYTLSLLDLIYHHTICPAPLPNMKKIVVKVSIACEKCKTLIMKTVATLQGIKSLSIDVEKSTLTVVGDVDPVCVVSALRKKKKTAHIESVGPEDKKKPDDPPKNKIKIIDCCLSCTRRPYMPPYGMHTVVWHEEPQYGCIIS